MGTTTKTATELFGEFRRDHEAALEPCVHCLFERCPPDDEEALHVLVEEYLTTAPRPPYSPVQHRRLKERIAPIIDRVLSDPGYQAMQDQLEAGWRDKPWWRRRWIRGRSNLWMGWWRFRIWCRSVGRKKPWE